MYEVCEKVHSNIEAKKWELDTLFYKYFKTRQKLFILLCFDGHLNVASYASSVT